MTIFTYSMRRASNTKTIGTINATDLKFCKK